MPKFYHGGRPGLKVGGGLLPPSDTGFTPTSAEINGQPAEGLWAAYRSDRVYATTNREFAEVFARLYTQDPNRPGEGVVYEVELEDPALDQDMSTFGMSWEAPRGRIAKPGMKVRTSIKRLDAVLKHYQAAGQKVNQERGLAAPDAPRVEEDADRLAQEGSGRDQEI